MRCTSSLIVFCSLTACRGHDSSPPPAGQSPATAPAARVAANADNPWCKDTTPSHPDPGQLVREYLRRDAGGEFLASNKFWQSATECAGEGTGAAAVITSYTVDSLGIRADTARFAVTYHFLGDLLQGSTGFAPRARTETDTFVVIHRPYGWRIVGTHDMPVLQRSAAQRFWPLTRTDLARLDSAARVMAAQP